MRVGYFIQWGIYGRNFLVKNLDTSGIAAKLTHINYAFGNVSADGRCFEANIPGQGDAWADYQTRFSAEQTVSGVADAVQPAAGRQLQPAQAAQGQVPAPEGAHVAGRLDLVEVLLRCRAHRRVPARVRGQLHRPVHQGQPAGARRPARRARVGAQACSTASTSTGSGRAPKATPGNIIRPEDKQNFTLLLAEFRRQLDEYGAQTGRHYGLTAFLPAAPSKIDAGFEVDQIFGYLDFATVQGYDFHGTWETTTNHQSQLFSPRHDPDAGPVQPGPRGQRAACLAAPRPARSSSASRTTAAAGPASRRRTRASTRRRPDRPPAPGRPGSRTTR